MWGQRAYSAWTQNHRVQQSGDQWDGGNSRVVTLYGVTPFGVYCVYCTRPLATQCRALVGHAQSEHGMPITQADRDALGRFLKAARARSFASVAPYLTGQRVDTTICGCGRSYTTGHGYKSHIDKSRDGRCILHNKTEMTTEVTVCGRHVNPIPKRMGDSARARAEEISRARETISKYVRVDENVQTYLEYLEPLTRLGWGGMETDDLLRAMVGWWDDKNFADDEHRLQELLEMAETWLFNVARTDVGAIAPSWRAKLVVFEGQEMGEIRQNTTYSFRHYEHSMWPELRKLLCFVWRCRFSQALDRVFMFEPWNQMLVPKLLFGLLTEEMEMVADLPLVVIYCLARCFRVGTTDDLTTVACGHASSDMACVMSIMRAGVCSMWQSWTVEQLSGTLEPVQQSVPVSRLAGMIRCFREMQRVKVNQRKKTVDDNGDIAVDGFLFEKRIWSQLIVLIHNACVEILGNLLAGSGWKVMLDVGRPIRVQREHAMEPFDFAIPGVMHSDGINLVDGAHRDEASMDELTSYIEICFHGCGGGSMRMEELTVLELQHMVWHRGTIYYTAASIKQFSVKRGRNTSHRQVERKLPAILARLYLVYRHIMRELLPPSSRVIVPMKKRLHTAALAIGEMFTLESKPSMLQVRHLWTSISNCVFPDGNPKIVCATEKSAELSGHSGGTHERKYGSEVVGGAEKMYQIAHEAMGDKYFTQKPDGQLTVDDLSYSLKRLFGEEADYTSMSQKSAVHASITGEDSVVLDGCGSGKSMNWLLPAVAEAVRKKLYGMQIVVVPYNFLVRHHSRTATDLVGPFGVIVEEVRREDVRNETLPDFLAVDDRLPDLVFVSLDCWVEMLGKQNAVMKRWAKEGRLRRVHIDEVHTLFFENFRTGYEGLPAVGGLQCPVSIYSGSLPQGMVPQLLRYLLLGKEANLVIGGSLFGPVGEMELRVEKARDTVSAAIRVLSSHIGDVIHVICSSRKSAEAIYDRMSGREQARLVTSCKDADVVRSVAEEWKQSNFKVLVSTTLALVGNENKQCRMVLIVGNLYSLANIVQGIGRLRPRQRIGSRVMVIAPMNIHGDMETQDNRLVQCLVHRQCLSRDQVATFRGVGTCRSVAEWVDDNGCRLVALAGRFGFLEQPCLQCDNCKGVGVLAEKRTHSPGSDGSTIQPYGLVTPYQPSTKRVAQTVAKGPGKAPRVSILTNPYNRGARAGATGFVPANLVVVTQSQASAQKANPYISVASSPAERANRVDERAAVSSVALERGNGNAWAAAKMLAKLESVCICCNRHTCSGDECVGYGNCFACGGPHYVTECKSKVPSQVVGRGCTSCLVLAGTIPQQAVHRDKTKCPVQRRFRRLLIQGWRQSRARQTFDDFCGPILCENSTMYEYLARNATVNTANSSAPR